MRIINFFQGWSAIRWMRLLTGVAAIIIAIIQKETLLGALGFFMLITSFTNNLGCCASTGCKVSKNPK